MTEFSSSFDRFDKAVLAGGLGFIAVSQAGIAPAAIGAGIIMTVVGVAKAGVKLGELRQKWAVERFQRMQDKMLAVNTAIMKAEQQSVLKDDALWAQQWRENPWAFWLCPDLWKNGTSEIDWEAVDRKPTPLEKVAGRLDDEVKAMQADIAEKKYREATNRIQQAVRSHGFLPGQVVEGVRRMGYAVHLDMLEIEYIDGKRTMIDNTYLAHLTPSQRIALVQDKVDDWSHARRREKVKDIVRFARTEYGNNIRLNIFGDLWLSAADPRHIHITQPEPPHRSIMIHDGMDPDDAALVAEWMGYHDESEDEFWD